MKSKIYVVVGIILLVIVGVLYYFYSVRSLVNVSARSPVIISITPQPVSVGDTVKIRGENLDILRDENSPMHILTMASITDSNGQAKLIFLPQGTADEIDFILPAKACKKELTGLGPPGSCPENGYIAISNGQYSMAVEVGGRSGESNSMQLIVR